MGTKTKRHALQSAIAAKTALALMITGMLPGLAACNGTQAGTKQNIEDDWIHDTAPAPEPSATPTATPTASPVPAPTPSASPTSTPVTGLYIGPASVEKYVQKYVDDAALQGVDVRPKMKNPTLEVRIASLNTVGSSTIGLCETGSGKRRVTFDPDFWDTASETSRELLAHHEFAHCVQYRSHRTTILPSGIYASLMYPTIMKSSIYLANYDYYQNELFTYGTSSAALQGYEGLQMSGDSQPENFGGVAE